MNVAVYSTALELITIIHIDVDFYNNLCKGTIQRFIVEILKDNEYFKFNKKGTIELNSKQCQMHVHLIQYENSNLKTPILLTPDTELALQLNPVILPGQVNFVQKLVRDAYEQGIRSTQNKDPDI